MGRSGSHIWTWTLCVLFSGMCAGQALGGPQYLVAIPAVLETGAETKFCASLLQANETLTMSIKLVSGETEEKLFEKSSDANFHECINFKVPLVTNEKVFNFVVVVQGNTYYSREVRKVMAKAFQPVSFIQTDKPLYLPGQTVHFRVVSLDTKFRPASRVYDVIEIEDAHDNRIAQWLNETSNGRILQLSYTLNSEASEGGYQIILTVGEEKKYHHFTVEKYVLPKFDVKINASDEVSIHQEEIEVEVCSKYTYGQPVPGIVSLSVCRLLNRYYSHSIHGIHNQQQIDDIQPPCYVEKKETDKKGCGTFTVEMSNFKKLHEKVLQDTLDMTAEVEEEGTGVTLIQMKRAGISYVIGKLSFIDTPKIYEKGSNVEGKIQALYYNNTPIVHMDLHLFKGERWSAELIQNLTTDNDGVATFSLSTADLSGDIKLHVSNKPTLGYAGYRIPYYEANNHVVSMAQDSSQDTKTVSSLQVQRQDKSLSCNKEEDITIKYTVVGETNGSAMLMYLILSQGAIVMQGFKQVDIQDQRVTEGEVSFKLNVHPEMAPQIQVLAYAVLPSETVVAHRADFSTEKCFSHKVSLEFSPSSAVPGDQTNMTVTAQPDSLCGISAVDQSVLIKKPGKTLDADKIFDLLPSRSYIPHEVLDSRPCLVVRPRRYILPYPGNREDAHTVFQDAGMKIATNLFVRMPSCLMFRGREYHEGSYGVGYRMYDSVPVVAQMNRVAMASPGGVGGSYPDPPLIQTVRTFFPETWLWDLVEVGASGKTDVSLTVPDTITTWETEAFCLSPQGFGLAPRKEITVFQPFFLELTLPYSIIRGEHFELKATVFNYLSSCIMVSVTSNPSSDYTLTPLSGEQYTSCLCGNERKTFRWTMAPSALGVMNVSVTAEALVSHVSCNNDIVSVPEKGRVDVVTRSLIVKAEGVEMSKTHNLLLCPKEETLLEEVDIKLPENVILGSARASVSVLGDILGRALKNLDGLLQMPYGCGEQNMALLSPNIYILHYLKNTQQLTPAILEKASNFLTSGYQRQLNYKHVDGAYSTFGTGTGNTWLTAFVMRSFYKAQSFVFIDPDNIEASRTWLENKQQENGCFEQSGKLFNNRMKGGVSDEVTLTAYITASLLETNMSADSEVINKSLSCLRESVHDLSNTYTASLMAYVFTLAGDMETRAHILEQLDPAGIEEGGFLHWSRSATETSVSLSVEISSYVLLAKLSASPTAEDLGYASRIVRWLTTQQNYYGGFSSTQDTVVALQALALYSSLVFSPDGSSTVTIQAPSGQLTFDVNQNNKLLYQEETLQDMSGMYKVEVKGNTCASAQISLHYNIPTPKNATAFSVEVKPNCTSKSRKLLLELSSLYRGKETSTNMVILDIKMLSGFVPDPESLKLLKRALLVDRVEQREDHVVVYLEELPKDIAIHHTLLVTEEQHVENLKPAVVTVYDYYQTSDKAETEYTYHCAEA